VTVAIVGREAGQALGQARDGKRQVAQAAAGEVLLIGVVLLQDGEPLKFSIGLGQGKHGRIARRNRLDLGIRQLLTANVIGAAAGIVAGHNLGDAACLGL
jgi:hypothetical protein